MFQPAPQRGDVLNQDRRYRLFFFFFAGTTPITKTYTQRFSSVVHYRLASSLEVCFREHLQGRSLTFSNITNIFTYFLNLT